MSEQVLIRCDGNTNVGYGHFSRCLNLARYLFRCGLKRIVFGGSFCTFAQAQIARYGFALREMTDYTLPVDLSGFQLCVLDSYAFEQSYLDYLCQQPYKVVLIDDFCAHNDQAVDLLFNPSIGAERFAYRARRVLLGPKYLPFKPEMAAVRLHHESMPATAVKHIGVFMGGRDHFDLGPALVRLLARQLPDARGVFIRSDPSQTLPAELVLWDTMQPSEALETVLQNMDVLICGGGLIKYEAAYCRIPSICLNQTPEQAGETVYLAQRHLTLDAGLASAFDKNRFFGVLSEVQSQAYRRRFQQASTDCFDLYSGEKLAKAIVACL